MFNHQLLSSREVFSIENTKKSIFINKRYLPENDIDSGNGASVVVMVVDDVVAVVVNGVKGGFEFGLVWHTIPSMLLASSTRQPGHLKPALQKQVPSLVHL